MIASAVSVFLASAVEVTEMAIIVAGVGAARGWRSTLIGAGAGFAILVAIVAGLGSAISLIPIDTARVVIGALLLTFGLQWLRKGIVGVAAEGFTGGEEEDEGEAPEGESEGALDWTAFVLSFKGVLLEGLEIAFIVVAFGAGEGGRRGFATAVVGAAAAFVAIGIVALLARKWLESVPGRSLKFGVGCLLTTFGTYWALEGLGVHWPDQKLSLLALLGIYVLAAFTYMSAVRTTDGAEGGGEPSGPLHWIVAFGRFWYEFVIGDDWVGAAGVAVLIAGAWGLLQAGARAFWLGPAVVVTVTGVTVWRAHARSPDRDG